MTYEDHTVENPKFGPGSLSTESRENIHFFYPSRMLQKINLNNFTVKQTLHVINTLSYKIE